VTNQEAFSTFLLSERNTVLQYLLLQAFQGLRVTVRLCLRLAYFGLGFRHLPMKLDFLRVDSLAQSRYEQSLLLRQIQLAVEQSLQIIYISAFISLDRIIWVSANFCTFVRWCVSK
jgi:hypothetical protein